MSGVLDGRVSLVTGAASGIGAATARIFAAEGARVVCADRDEQGLERLVRGLPEGSARAQPLDVTDEGAWGRALEGLDSHEGGLDVLVHAAGISAASPLRDTTLADWRRVLQTNLDGSFLAIRSGLRAMEAMGGSIVLVGSASGIRAAKGAAAYSTSKAALRMLVEVAAKECRDLAARTRVNLVSPGGVRTPLWRTMPFFQELVRLQGSEDAAFAALCGPGERFAEPEEIARVLLFLASDASSHVNGVELPVDGGSML